MPPTGDEPHYLVVAHSLAIDHDLSLLNNYERRHYRAFYPGELAKRTSPSADRKRELPAQGLGLSFLLAPFYKFAITTFPSMLVAFLRLMMCSITMVVLYNMLLLLFESRISKSVCFLVGCGAFLASPLLPYSSLFYPEIPACLLLTIALRQLRRIEEHRWRAFLWLSLIPAALLWLHPKYFALGLCICITAAIYFYRTFRVYSDGSHYRLTFLYAVVSCAGMFSFFLFLHDQYGSWSPNRIYAGWEKAPQTLVELVRQEGFGRVGTMLRMAIGLWIDQRFGLISHAPLYVHFFPGAIVMLSGSTRRFIFVWFAIHFLMLCWGAPLGGYAPPSRHMIVLLPLILIPMSLLVAKISDFKKLLAVLMFVISWFLAALMYLHYRLLFTNVTWRNPDGVSPFWERLGVDSWLPSLTATNPQWLLVLLWCILLSGLSWLIYPRARQKEANP